MRATFGFLAAGVILLSIGAGAQVARRVFNIADFGNSIQTAIDAAADAGGGEVVIPPGSYSTGPIRLKSNIELHIEKGARVLFSRRYEDYPLVIASFEGHDAVQCTSPISGDHLENVSITGGGTFDGNGQAWRPVKKEKLSDAQWGALVASGGAVETQGASAIWYPTQAARDGQAALHRLQAAKPPLRMEDYEPYHVILRPALMLLSNCKNVTLDGATFRNSPGWNLHLFCSDNLTIRNVTVYNEIWAQNGDGMDIDSCRDVRISDCTVDGGDDVICLKSGRDEAGRKLNRPTENVTITNCTIGHGHGGIAIGSETAGGVRHVNVSHCVMNGTDAGLRFKTTRGRGGIVEDINISDIQMTDIRQGAIEFSMFYMSKDATTKPVAVGEGTPRFRDFHISNIRCTGAKTAISLRGLPEMPIEGITIENARISADNPGEMIDGKNITLNDVHIRAKNGGHVKVTRVMNLVMPPSSSEISPTGKP